MPSSPPVRGGGPCAPPGRGGGGGGDFIAVTREFLTGRAGAELGVPHLGAWAADRPGWASGAGGGAAVSRASGAISGWPFPGGSPPPGTPGKAARSSALRPRAGRAGGACAWKQPSQDPGPRDSPRSAGAGGLHFFFFPGGSYCRLVGEGPVTGQVPRLRLRGLEEACGPSQDRTVQKCLLPCPALAQAKIPGLAAPFSAGGGRGGRASSRPVPGSATRRDGGILPIQVEPDLWPVPGPLVEPLQAGTSVYLPYRGAIPPAR